MQKKKVLYLLGAGATHGMLQDFDIHLMPNDIRDWILDKFGDGSAPIDDQRAWNAFNDTPDVEHFISILEYQNKFTAAEAIRQQYREAILAIAGSVSKAPPRNNLYSVLLDYQLHLAKRYLNEELLGFVSFNYEDILENTITTYFRPVSYLFKCSSGRMKGDALRVYKLHGSFNWLNTRPIQIEKMNQARTRPTLWIPPGIDKKKDSYPFNLLWGRLTEELLKCDTLRVIGCSLSRNDWGLIPVLYTMREFVGRKPFEIEIIAAPPTAQRISDNYGYLTEIKSMLDMPEVVDYFRAEIFDGRDFEDDEAFNEEISDYLSDHDKGNPFRHWLWSKVRYLTENLGHPLRTRRGIVQDFYYPD